MAMNRLHRSILNRPIPTVIDAAESAALDKPLTYAAEVAAIRGRLGTATTTRREKIFAEPINLPAHTPPPD